MHARYLGTTDDVTTCECCGRTGLKGTVAIILNDAPDPVYYGVTCAAHALNTTAKEVRYEAKRADTLKREKERAEREEAQFQFMAAWAAWLDLKVPTKAGSIFEQIESLGGYNTAREMFEAERAR
jgi:hypothetical protein